jgi:heme-degrading monooxygenase HmoA
MKTIYQTGMLLLFFVISCTTAMAQNTGKQTESNSQSKKSNMQVVLIDRFIVPNGAKEEFLERANINRDFIKHLPGFVEDNAYEEVGEAQTRYVTVAVWANEEAFQKARAAVGEEYKRQNFNPAELVKRLNIQMERGVYKKTRD